MDIFKFLNPNAATKMEQGVLINGIKKKMWIERYAEAGEFTFQAPISSGLRELLPLGTFISHINTKEIMIVENHEITDQPDTESWITVSGRGYETYLENRIVGANKTFPVADSPDRQFIVEAGYSWVQAQYLVRYHTKLDYVLNVDDAIPYLSVDTGVSGYSAVEGRSIDRGTVYERMLEILAIDNLGIMVIRPGPWSTQSPSTVFKIHKGEDKTEQVSFSYDSGEIINADYLWSIRTLKTAAYVTSKWVELVVDSGNPEDINYNRRMVHVDASDLDDRFESAPTGTDLDAIVAWMERRGRDAIASQNGIALTKAEVSGDAARAKYREDYMVGDLISVSGGYNESSIMRIQEYVEIEDENGETGYPTLTIPEATPFPYVVILEDSMLFKRGAVYLLGGNPEQVTIPITFTNAFASDDYGILLSETVVTDSDPIDEIGDGFLRAYEKTAAGFTIMRTQDTNGVDHHLRVDWFAYLTDNAEGEIAEV